MHHIVEPKVEGSISGLSSDGLWTSGLARRQQGETWGAVKCGLILATPPRGDNASPPAVMLSLKVNLGVDSRLEPVLTDQEEEYIL